MSAPIVHKPPPEGGIRVINAAQPWGLRNLFSGVVQGAWCDPEAGNTQFQDAAAPAPVTAVEQQLGARLDRSGWGNHATQATAGKRPAYSRRVNYFTESEFPYGLSGAPTRNGLLTASALPGYAGAITFGHNGTTASYAYKSADLFGVVAVLSVVVKMTDGLPPVTSGANSEIYFFLVVNGGAVTTEKMIALGDGCYRVFSYPHLIAASNTGIVKYQYNSPRTFQVTAYDLRPAAEASLPYQRVTTSVDYDADPTKFPAYITANGTTSMMQSASGAGGTTGFYYCAPIRLLKLGAVQVLWSDATGNTGYEVRINASNQLELGAGTGAARVSVASAALVLGRTYILTATHDGAALSVQVDSGAPVSAACGPIAAGTAGYTLFRAAGADTGYANVREYGFVYTKNHCPSATHRAMAAQILAAKARITA